MSLLYVAASDKASEARATTIRSQPVVSSTVFKATHTGSRFSTIKISGYSEFPSAGGLGACFCLSATDGSWRSIPAGALAGALFAVETFSFDMKRIPINTTLRFALSEAGLVVKLWGKPDAYSAKIEFVVM